MAARLSLTLTAGKADTDANVAFTFGKLNGSVTLSAVAMAKKEAPKDAAAPAKEEGKSKGDGK